MKIFILILGILLIYLGATDKLQSVTKVLTSNTITSSSNTKKAK